MRDVALRALLQLQGGVVWLAWRLILEQGETEALRDLVCVPDKPGNFDQIHGPNWRFGRTRKVGEWWSAPKLLCDATNVAFVRS
jgi:hypothetical protein